MLDVREGVAKLDTAMANPPGGCSINLLIGPQFLDMSVHAILVSYFHICLGVVHCWLGVKV